MLQHTKKWTVLVYTMILVVIWVFMASAVLNVSVELSSQYEINKLEDSLSLNMREKSDVSMKYARLMNHDGNGFIDNISCPQDITMSGSTMRTTWINTQIRFMSGAILCLWESAHIGNDLALYFNSQFDDFQYAEYEWRQVTINASNLSDTFWDSDTTQIDLWSAAYFIWDGIDDNFNSDNYSSFSTWSTLYPDAYYDRDDKSKLMNFGYILEWTDLYNILWTNSRMNNYIKNVPSNTLSNAVVIWDVTQWHLHLDIDSSYRLALYRINKNIYNYSRELVIESSQFLGLQPAGNWYIQNDLSLSNVVNVNTMAFDFTTNDYALFIENNGSGALFYKLTAQEALTWTGIYINPLDDSDPSILGYLASDMIVDNEGKLIADQSEFFGLKSDTSSVPVWMTLWLDASDRSSVTTSAGTISQWNDKSGNGNNAIQVSGTSQPTYNAADGEVVMTSSEYLSIIDNSTIQPTWAITIALWIKPSDINTFPFAKLTGQRAYWVAIRADSTVSLFIAPEKNIINSIQTTTTLTTDQWVFLTLEYDPDNLTGKIYFNWVSQPLSTTVLPASQFTSNGQNLVINRRPDDIWDGQNSFGSIFMYNRVLTNTEIISLYTHTAPTSSFTPSSIESLVAWYDASDTATITQSSGLVSQWDDKSGNGNHIIQSNESYQASTGVETLNGLNVMSFLYNDYFNAPNITDLQTTFIVYKDTSTRPWVTPIGADRWRLLHGYSDNTRLFSSVWTDSTTLNGYNYKNGIEVGDGSTTARPVKASIFNFTQTAQFTGDVLTIGSDRYSPSFRVINGYIAEIIFIDRVLSANETNQIGNYLANKWEINWVNL